MSWAIVQPRISVFPTFLLEPSKHRLWLARSLMSVSVPLCVTKYYSVPLFVTVCHHCVSRRDEINLCAGDFQSLNNWNNLTLVMNIWLMAQSDGQWHTVKYCDLLWHTLTHCDSMWHTWAHSYTAKWNNTPPSPFLSFLYQYCIFIQHFFYYNSNMSNQWNIFNPDMIKQGWNQGLLLYWTSQYNIEM